MAVIYLDTQQHTIMITRRGFQNYKTLKKVSVTKFSTLIFSLSQNTLPCAMHPRSFHEDLLLERSRNSLVPESPNTFLL